MKVSWNWLGEWVDLDGLEPEEVAERMTAGGLEVKGLERRGAAFADIVVGRIDSIEDHPDADRLVVCHVDAGADTTRTIVCGASNMEAGDRVPVALPGASPPAVDFTIEEREVMGVASSGMLCSEEELGLADSSEGLMILPEELAIGEPIGAALGLDDIVLELDLTPNRPDCLGHRGIALEVSALFGRERRTPSRYGADDAPAWETTEHETPASDWTLTVDAPEGCPRYVFAVLEDVSVGDSPLWMKTRLHAVGLRSINNIVDTTNYVLMDIGQPLHAFDLDALVGDGVTVRRARAGEEMEGIDHRRYELDEEDLVIADDEGPVALAGVMGGARTEVSDETRRVLLECAYFEPSTVRRSARRHSLHTDSSHRFERGVDPGATRRNASRAVDVLAEVGAAGEEAAPAIARGAVEFLSDAFDFEPNKILLPREMPGRILGATLERGAIISLLESIAVEVHDDGGDALSAVVPTWRPDLLRPIDLVEELARLHGFDQIEATLPERSMGFVHELHEHEDAHPPTIESSARRRVERRLRDALADQGLQEVVNYSFMARADLDRLGLPDDDRRREVREVANPLVREQALMRTTLVPGLLATLKHNLDQHLRDVALFEIGRCYLPEAERRSLVIAVEGRAVRHWSDDRSWDFYDLKGIVEALGTGRELGGPRWSEPDEAVPYLHPGVQAIWGAEEGAPLAHVGQLHPEIAREFDLEVDVLLAEIELEELLDAPDDAASYRALSRYPAITRDYAFVVDDDTSWGQMHAEIEALADEDQAFGALSESVALFDVYEGEQIPEGSRSLAIEIRYRADDRTLTDGEIARLDEALVARLEDRLGARQR